ncbi:unnamed protein product [Phytophthora lilii]|uniref:Unnamed protein product n=1 Tax=Phytophthora lilii TaxID=2077276 RepID=A0A9W6XIY7_9STRA|nr:unnamed protein product [Phytophthora lilii]
MRKTGGVTDNDDDKESSDEEDDDEKNDGEVSEDDEEDDEDDDEEEKAEVPKVETVVKTEPGFEQELNAARFRRVYEERYVAELARSRSQVYGSSGYAGPGGAYYLSPSEYGGYGVAPVGPPPTRRPSDFVFIPLYTGPEVWRPDSLAYGWTQPPRPGPSQAYGVQARGCPVPTTATIPVGPKKNKKTVKKTPVATATAPPPPVTTSKPKKKTKTKTNPPQEK